MVRITARCSFCARHFTPSVEADGEPVFVDLDGALCCDDCYHGACGRGHVTETDRDECDAEIDFPDTGWFDADPDVEYDRFRDRLIGV